MLAITRLGQFSTQSPNTTSTGTRQGTLLPGTVLPGTPSTCPSGTHYDSIEQTCVPDTSTGTTLVRRATLLPGAEAVPSGCGPEPGPRTGVRWICRDGTWKAQRIAPYVWRPPTALDPHARCFDVALSRIVGDDKCLAAGLPKPGGQVPPPAPVQPSDVIVTTTPPAVVDVVDVPAASYDYQAEAPAPIYKRPWFWLVALAVAGGGTYVALRRR